MKRFLFYLASFLLLAMIVGCEGGSSSGSKGSSLVSINLECKM